MEKLFKNSALKIFILGVALFLWTSFSFSQITTVTTADTSFCVPTAIQLNTTPSGGSAYTYLWSPALGLSSTIVANPTANPAITTTYSVLITETTTNDTVSDAVTITIQNVPPPLLLNPLFDTICAGDTTVLDIINSANCSGSPGSCLTASSTSTVGSGTNIDLSQWGNPFFQIANFFLNVRSSKRQIIYTKSELNAAGIVGPTNISALAFNFPTVSGTFTYNNFRINIGCTSNSAMGNSYLTGLSNVFSPKTVSIGASGWKEFLFENPFSWNGTDNIVVELCYVNPVAANGTPPIQMHITSSNMCRLIANNNNVCGSLNGTPFNGRPNTRFRHCELIHSSALTYLWTPGAGLSSSVIKNPLANPPITTSYVLTVTDALGCEFIDTTTVFVVPNFNLSINSDTTLCQADTLNLIATSNGTNVSYKWTAGANIVNDTLQTTKGYFAAPSLVSLQAKSAAGCEKDESFQVDFNPLVDGNILTKDTSICLSDSIQLNVSTNAADCNPYSWLNCVGTQSETFTGTSAFASGGVTLSPFDAAGALSLPGQKKQYLILASEISSLTNTDAITSLGFNLQSVPTATAREGFTIKMMCTSISSFGITAGNFESGAQTVFTPKTINISTGWNDFIFDNGFVWDGSSNIIIEICWQNTAPLPFGISTLFWTNAGFRCVALEWNSPAFCSDTTYLFTTFNRPDMRLNYCFSPPNPGFKYQWQPTAGLENDTIPEPKASPSSTSTYLLTVTDPITGCADQDSVTIIVAPNFNTNVTADSILCFFDTVQLNVTHTSPGIVTYNWQPAGLLNNNTIPNPTVYVNGGKVIVSEVKSSLGCIKWDTVHMGIPDQIVSSINTIGQVKCAGDSVQFSVNQTLGCGMSSNQLCSSLSTAVIGTATTTSAQFNTTPFVATSPSSKKHFLIKKSELNGAGFISSGQLTSLSFEITNLGKTKYENFQIRMGCTNLGQLTTSFTNTLEVVFDSKDVNLTLGVNWFDFDNRFNWDGASNIIVEVCYLNSGVGMNSEVAYHQPNPVYNGLLYSRGLSVCSDGSGTRYIRKPNMQFKYCPFIPINFNYSWSPPNLFNDPGLQNPKAVLANPGKYFLSITNNLTQCISEDSVALSFIEFDVNALGDTSICSTKNYQLDVITNAVNPKYQWTPANQVSNDTISNPLITIDNGINYFIEVTDSSGCRKMDTVEITLLPQPTAVVSPNVNACRFQDVQLAGNGGGDYSWTPSTGLSDPTIPNPIVNTDKTTIYVLRVRNSFGCIDEDSVTVTIYPSPILDLGPDTSYCLGGSLELNAGSDFDTYRWHDGSTDSIYRVFKDGVYWVKVIDKFLCEFTDTLEVFLSPPPVTGINWNTDICEGDSAILDALNPGASYLWSTGELSQKIVVKDSGFYWVLINTGRCEAKDSTIARIYEYPKSILEDEIVYCEKEYPYGINVVGGSVEYRYQWSNGQVTNTVILASEGHYSVKITAGRNCSLIDEFDVKHLCSEFIYVPNSFTPNNDMINDEFRISAGNMDSFEILIYNRWGEVIFRSTNPDFSWDGTLDGNEMLQGTYVWKIYYTIKEADGTLSEKDETGTFNLLR